MTTYLIKNIKQKHNLISKSIILVMGGSGYYFDFDDSVIMMEAYIPYNVTAKAKEIMLNYPLEREEKAQTTFGEITKRQFDMQTLQTKKGNRSKTEAKGLSKILMGRTEIIFEQTEQLVDPSQTRMIEIGRAHV